MILAYQEPRMTRKVRLDAKYTVVICDEIPASLFGGLFLIH